ncbi:TonB-dependent receptor [Tunicatimonas pelagia]|uniref:TonB-dependent receptor n=1 Tax=Tunicatimonas pelagia TaxID=931531 RepID=UPI0026652169|nr:TonB-dependent receptor [Tunicatimonas pelagia]WKN43147.1 TonB-dependent receptor [Tunicatimonas pelagia]
MKSLVLIALAYFSALIQVPESLDKEVVLSKQTLTVKEVLKELDRQSSFTFSYSNRIPLQKKISFGKQSGSMRYFLDRISRDYAIQYKTVNEKILLLREKKRSPTKKKKENATISGYITDASTGEELIGATVYIQELETGTVTNVYGYYSLSVPPGEYTLVLSFIGYQRQRLTVPIEESQTLNVEMAPEEVQLEEVIVTASETIPEVQEMEMSTAKVDIQTIQKMPALLGEVDVIRSIQLLPGVSTVGEGAPGFNVRGGSVDQNLILLDEAPVFSSSHLLGFFSVFNPDAVKDIKLYKGGIPARYGGRLSSVLDVRQKEGNTKRFGLKGGIGLISSRLLAEGPIQKDKSSFMVAGRRSYGDLFLRMSNNEDINNTIIYFYDLNTKVNYKINDRNRLYLSGYFGRDVFGGAVENLRFDWGNRTGTLRWNHLFNDKLFSNFTAIYSDYNYRLAFANNGTDAALEEFEWQSSVTNRNLQADFTYFPSLSSTIDFGVSGIYYDFNPGSVTIRTNDQPPESPLDLNEEHAIEAAAYFNHEKKFGDRVTLQYGLRYSAFMNIGERDVFEYENGTPSPDNAVIDTVSYGAGEIIKFYDGLEPRFSLNYSLSKQTALKVSYNRLFQYIQLVSNTTAATPIDIWTPANQYIQPAIVDQIALGYFRNFRQNTFEFSAEVYYKNFQDLIDFRNGAELILNENLETELLSGNGRAYGLELLLKKREGRWTGWLSYTLARTERQVDGINNNEYYPSNFDKPHDVSLVLNYNINKKWNASANFAYMTGRPTTPPAARFVYQGIVVPDYTGRNGARTPDYHRLDLSVNYEPPPKPGRRWRNSWNFGVYNVYARRNPYSVFFRPNSDNPAITEAVQLSIFANLIPSITYNFTF